MIKRFDENGSLIPRQSMNDNADRSSKSSPSRRLGFDVPSEIGVMLDWVHIMDDRPKSEIVIDSIRIATILWKYLPPDKMDMIRAQNLEPLFKDVSFKFKLPKNSD